MNSGCYTLGLVTLFTFNLHLTLVLYPSSVSLLQTLYEFYHNLYRIQKLESTLLEKSKCDKPVGIYQKRERERGVIISQHAV